MQRLGPGSIHRAARPARVEYAGAAGQRYSTVTVTRSTATGFGGLRCIASFAGDCRSWLMCSDTSRTMREACRRLMTATPDRPVGVNDATGRYFEPGAPRSVLVALKVSQPW